MVRQKACGTRSITTSSSFPHPTQRITRRRRLPQTKCANFGGGQVDITNGNFVFSASESYLIEDGKQTRPVRNATLIGNGPESLRHVSMVGSNLELDEGMGICGKEGQSVPVGVGMPTVKIDKMTVGGTA